MNPLQPKLATVLLLCLLAGSNRSLALPTPEPEKVPERKAMRQQKGLQAHEAKLENAEGGSLTFSQLQGKVTILIVCGKDSADAGLALMQEITLATAQEKELAYVLAADLRGVPGFMRGQARGKVKGKLKSRHEDQIQAFKKAGVPFEPRHSGTILLDWSGSAAKEFGLKGNLDSAYQVVVLDRRGNVTFQCAQPDRKQGGAASTAQIVKAVQRTLTANVVK